MLKGERTGEAPTAYLIFAVFPVIFWGKPEIALALVPFTVRQVVSIKGEAGGSHAEEPEQL